MKKAETPKLIPAAGYVRMSTDMQADSPARQRGEIEALAQRDSYTIIRWYEDKGLSGTESKNRPEFQKLMKAAEKREFQAVLMFEQSRFSREDIFDAMVHWKILKTAGVKLVTPKGEMDFDSLAGMLTALIGQHGARGESINIAHRVLSGRKRKASEGAYQTRAPFGFDRLIFNEAGEVMKRVTCWEKFKRPKTWTSKLVPSEDAKVIAAVQFAFESVLKGVSLRCIAIELNKRGFTTSGHCLFDGNAVRRIIDNPVYKGTLRFGHVTKGKFARCDDELILVADAHPGIVSERLFDQAKAILDGVYKRKGTSIPGRYLLSTLVKCAHCGRNLIGAFQTGQHWGPEGHSQYCCRHSDNGTHVCDVHPSISADALEKLVLRLICKHILCDENKQRIQDAARRILQRQEGPSIQQNQLDELRQKILRGEANLGLLEGENFKALASQLDQWREKANRLASGEGCVSPKASLSVRSKLARISDLQFIRDHLGNASRILLASAINHSVVSVVIGRETRAGWKYPQCCGKIEFNPEAYDGGVIEFDEEDLFPERRYLEVARFVQKQRRPVVTREIAKALKLEICLTLYHAKRAAAVGLCSMKRTQAGWQFESLKSI